MRPGPQFWALEPLEHLERVSSNGSSWLSAVFGPSQEIGPLLWRSTECVPYRPLPRLLPDVHSLSGPTLGASMSWLNMCFLTFVEFE